MYELCGPPQCHCDFAPLLFFTALIRASVKGTFLLVAPTAELRRGCDLTSLGLSLPAAIEALHSIQASNACEHVPNITCISTTTLSTISARSKRWFGN